MASKRSKVAPRTEPEEPEEAADDAADSDGAEEQAQADGGDDDEPADEAEGEPPVDEPDAEAERTAARRGEEEVQLAPPPMRLFALFLIPLFALLVWALFFK